MAAFLQSQLDFILFFYGLAFILLGVTAFAIARGGGRRDEAWAWLGGFGLIHGASEWLDLSALIITDTPAFAIARTAVMAISFVVLLEFARRELGRLGRAVIDPWIYIPLILLVLVCGMTGGLPVAKTVARYTIAFPAALGTSHVFWLRAKSLQNADRRLAVLAAASFALYAVAAGLIVPDAPFGPANFINQTWHMERTGIPIQLVRGALACCAAFSIWGIWGQNLIEQVASTRYTKFLHKQFVWTLMLIPAILVFGWMLTNYLGQIYERNLRDEARGDLTLLTSRLDGETAAVNGMAQALAGSPTMALLFAGKISPDNDEARSVLKLAVSASEAKRGYILDAAGKVIADSDTDKALALPPSLASMTDHHFVLNSADNTVEYFASAAAHDRNGGKAGTAVLQKTLPGFESELSALDRDYFLLDPNGIVTLTNRPAQRLRMMWPLSSEKLSDLKRQFPGIHGPAMLKKQPESETWGTIDGERAHARQINLDHTGWSLVMLTPIRGIFASRVLGIAITLLTTIMALMYLVGRQRLVHDHVQMDKHLELQELARDLDYIATTDPLTSLCNRLKFNKVLAQEMLRSQRYGTPLSLILYDVDRFKEVNDAHGHQVGDSVLIELSQFVAARVRRTDLLARWGGEEFVILVPESDGQRAYDLAQSLATALLGLRHANVGAVTCSFGVTQFVDGDTAESFLERADEALYRAKMNGRNRVELRMPPGEAQYESVA